MRQRISRLVSAASAFGAFLADIGLFAGTLVVVWGGLTWLGVEVDRTLGTGPQRSVIPGQAGPFAMLGVISGLIASLFAINWLTSRSRRKH